VPFVFVFFFLEFCDIKIYMELILLLLISLCKCFDKILCVEIALRYPKYVMELYYDKIILQTILH